MSTTEGEDPAAATNDPVIVARGRGNRYPAPMTEPRPQAESRPDWAQGAEERILDAAVHLAPEFGWTGRTLRKAAVRAGLTEAEAHLLLPNGPSDLAALLWRRDDRAGLQALAEVEPRNLKIRERISRAVQARVEAPAAHEAASRRLLGFLALPHHMPLGARLLWDSADVIWRWAGDKATDENHYSKRATLSGVLGPAIAIRLASGRVASDEYVFRRINDVMAFERWKAGLPKADLGFQLAGALGRFRYGLKPPRGSEQGPAA